MHEIGIANSILEAVLAEATRHSGSRPRRVGIKIGELSAVDPDSLRFCFGILTQGTELETLELEIETCPRRHFCGDCNREFQVNNYDFHCPSCGEQCSQCVSGEQLELSYLEMEEHAARTA